MDHRRSALADQSAGRAEVHLCSLNRPNNDAGMLAWNREADYFLQMIKDQFDTLYREGAETGVSLSFAASAQYRASECR
jgi:hypothetical protein